VHSTALGPANGGVRMYPYDSWEDATRDAMRLARAMTYKWAAAGEDRGGGKSVIIGDPRKDKNEALLRAFGRFVDQLRGEYYVGEDVGISLSDMELIHLETDYVATLPVEAGGVGDIAPATARGVVRAMQACTAKVWGSPDLAGRTVAVQGLGAVGGTMLPMLLEAGATVTVTDIDQDKLDRVASDFPVHPVGADEIYSQDVDIFAPCAMGQIVNDETIPMLKARVVCGSANNQFAAEHHAAELERLGIVYAVDFVANAGGAIYDAEQFRKGGFSHARVQKKIDAIFDRTEQVFAAAERSGTTYVEAAYQLAEKRLRDVAGLRRV
jgi:leucine dehydrogenase